MKLSNVVIYREYLGNLFFCSKQGISIVVHFIRRREKIVGKKEIENQRRK